ncbi:stealth family protein [Kitasatospora sp. NPDC052896]|uniref:stealth family protein n=1 Tax=Kitasatospora sp. NPDC052896 TaxID=3364061 RepID=UPI0037CB7AA3
MIRGSVRRARRIVLAADALPRQRGPEPEPVVEEAPEPEPTEADRTVALEDALGERRPELVRHDGRLAEVRDDLLAADALLAGFTEATELLTAAGLEFVPMPAREPRYRVAIPPGGREAVLEACAAAFVGQPVYADLLGHDVTLGTVLAEQLPQAVAELERDPAGEAEGEGEDEPADAAPAPAVLAKGVRLYRPVVTSGRTLYYGAEYGCELEFWDSAEPSEGAIASIHEPPFGWWVPSLEPTATVRLGGRDYPTAAAFTQPLLTDVTFPVDAVITWVDDSDPVWRRRRDAALAELDAPPAGGTGQERFHNRDELRYCLRSIAMYAPWIRHIYLVTDGQVPDWLRVDHPDLTVVHHRELFADPSVLPVFNSHAIETQLHRIQGLSEHFIYFNDDVFLGRPVSPEQFFLGNGAPLITLDSRVIPPGELETTDDEYVASQKNTRAVVQRVHGRHTTNVLSHAAHPLTRGLLAETAEQFAAELTDTARAAFRSRADLAPITLAVTVGYLSQRVAFGRIGHRYVDVDRYAALEQLPGLLRDRGIDTFCLNDGDLDHVPRVEQDRIVTRFLQDYFPVAGPFELTPPVEAARHPEPSETDQETDESAGSEPAGADEAAAGAAPHRSRRTPLPVGADRS